MLFSVSGTLYCTDGGEWVVVPWGREKRIGAKHFVSASSKGCAPCVEASVSKKWHNQYHFCPQGVQTGLSGALPLSFTTMIHWPIHIPTSEASKSK